MDSRSPTHGDSNVSTQTHPHPALCARRCMNFLLEEISKRHRSYPGYHRTRLSGGQNRCSAARTPCSRGIATISLMLPWDLKQRVRSCNWCVGPLLERLQSLRLPKCNSIQRLSKVSYVPQYEANIPKNWHSRIRRSAGFQCIAGGETPSSICTRATVWIKADRRRYGGPCIARSSKRQVFRRY